MAFVAAGLSPRLPDIFRVLEAKSFRIDCLFLRAGRPLRDYRMAGPAIASDRFAILGLMTTAMTAIAALGIEMADIIRVDVPADLHRRKIICRVNILQGSDSLFDSGICNSGIGEISRFVELPDFLADLLQSFSG